MRTTDSNYDRTNAAATTAIMDALREEYSDRLKSYSTGAVEVDGVALDDLIRPDAEPVDVVEAAEERIQLYARIRRLAVRQFGIDVGAALDAPIDQIRAWDVDDISYRRGLAESLGREPTDAEYEVFAAAYSDQARTW